MQAGMVAVGTLLLSSPWWLNILLRFGFDPFLSTLHTGMYGTSILVFLKNIVLSRQSIVPVLLLLRLAGIVWCLWKRKFFLVAWVILPIIVEPRSSDVIALYPLSMLAAIGFTDALLFLINRVRERHTQPLLEDVTQSRVLNLTIMSIILYLFLESFAVNIFLVGNSLKPPAVEAMTWAQSNTPVDSKFLVLTGNPGVMTDPLLEWFPALANRSSQNTVQGLEWTLGPSFGSHVSELVTLQSCETSSCIEAWSAKNNAPFSYLFVRRSTAPRVLHNALQNENYKLAYENQDIVVLYKLK